MLSFPPPEVSLNGVKQPPNVATPIPDPLTLASLREAISEEPKRMHDSIAETAQRSRKLGLPAAAKTIGAGIPASLINNPALLGHESPGARLRASMDAIINSPYLKQQRETAELTRGAVANMGILTNTSAIAESLARFQETTRAAQRLAAPINFATRSPSGRSPSECR